MNKSRLMLAVIVLLSACNKPQQSNLNSAATLAKNQLTGKVQLDGSSTVFPISEAVSEEFNAVAPGVRVTVGVSGTGGGFKKFVNNEIDINDASRPMKPSEIARAEAAGISFIELPVAFDGLSVVINPKNDWVDYLTINELNKIWMPKSKVQLWSDIRPGWPQQKIRLYGPGTDSGTFDYFTKVVNGKEQSSRADFTASEDDNVIVRGIAGDVYSLGYFGFAYYQENRDTIDVVAIDAGKGPIKPSAETINNGTYAPLSRPIFIYVNLASLGDPAVARYVDFYLESAAILSSEVGYIALPDAVYHRAKVRIDMRETGTAYSGENRVSTLIDAN